MAYSKGRSRLLRDRGQEQVNERARYEREIVEAEDALRGESGKASLWQTIGSGVGAVGGFFAGGPAGAYKGYLVGKEVGRWGQKGFGAITGTSYDPKDYAVSTDVGRFDLSQKYDLEEINRQFEEAEESRKWQDITGTGESLIEFLNPPKLEGKEWWTKTGEGKGAPDWLRKIHSGNPNLRSGKEYAWGGRRGQ